MATPIPENRARFTLREVAGAVGGRAIGADVALEGVVTDSRRVRPGCLYVALRGEHHDGHGFVPSALAAGAAAALVEAGRAEVGDAAGVEVNDTLDALGALAAFHRRRWGGRAVAITGSAGKTTTKELTHAALAATGARVTRTEGNLNNLVGLPMTVLCLDESHDLAVLELGTSAPGEIARLARIADAGVAVVTSVSLAHTMGLGSLAAVAEEKAALLYALPEDGVAIYSADHPELVAQLDRVRARRRIGFGIAPSADVRLVSHALQPDLTMRCRYAFASGAPERELVLQLVGVAAALDAAAALSVVVALGLEAALDEAASGLARVRPGAGRMRPVQVRSGALIVDDSYNANPASVAASLATAAELAKLRGGALRVALGDMKELGDASRDEHAAVGRALIAHGVTRAVLCGPEMAAAAEAARCAPASDLVVQHQEDAAGASASLAERLGPDDVVLVKGSRSMATERVVEALVAELGGAA